MEENNWLKIDCFVFTDSQLLIILCFIVNRYCDDCGRVTAEIVNTPSLHVQLECPDGTKVAIGLDSQEEIKREELINELPDYCRQFCPIDTRRH
jgi:hypothetical protein